MIDTKYILNWKSRIEGFTGLDCSNIDAVLNKGVYTIDELRDAYYDDRNWFIGYADSIMSRC